MEGRYLCSLSRDPAVNLALEEQLLEAGEPALYLWRNAPTVVIGRNQNPYRECDPARLRAEGVSLMRRRSGGGAVYHDPGNLNFTILGPAVQGCVETNFAFLIAVLARLGIAASVSGRNDLEAGGRKISGSAFFAEGGCLCHHGTLLVDAELSALSRFLTPSPLKLQSRGIESLRSRVANLSELCPGLRMEEVIAGFTAERGREPERLGEAALSALPGLSEKISRYRSPSWTLGDCPGYNVFWEERFPFGLVQAELRVEKGRIRRARLYTDALFTGGFRSLEESLPGSEFSPERLRSAVQAEAAAQGGRPRD